MKAAQSAVCSRLKITDIDTLRSELRKAALQGSRTALDEERDEGHADTHRQNHECENKDPNLGCNLGIDVAG